MPLARSEVHKAAFRIEHWGGCVSPLVIDEAEVDVPAFLAGEVVGKDAGGPEVCEHQFSIRYGRGRARGVGGVEFFRDGGGGSFLPEDFSVLSIDGEEEALVGYGLGEEDTVIPDDGRAVASLGQVDFPAHLIGAPADWKLRFHGDSGAERAAPLWPWSRLERQRSEGNENRKE